MPQGLFNVAGLQQPEQLAQGRLLLAQERLAQARGELNRCSRQAGTQIGQPAQPERRPQPGKRLAEVEAHAASRPRRQGSAGGPRRLGADSFAACLQDLLGRLLAGVVENLMDAIRERRRLGQRPPVIPMQLSDRKQASKGHWLIGRKLQDATARQEHQPMIAHRIRRLVRQERRHEIGVHREEQVFR